MTSEMEEKGSLFRTESILRQFKKEKKRKNKIGLVKYRTHENSIEGDTWKESYSIQTKTRSISLTTRGMKSSPSFHLQFFFAILWEGRDDIFNLRDSPS